MGSSDLDRASSRQFRRSKELRKGTKDPKGLIPGFHDHSLKKGNISLSAYGKYRYALVIDEYFFVIYNPYNAKGPSEIHYKLKSNTFTSITADGNQFFLTISDGSILHCFKKENSNDYHFIVSDRYHIHGFITTKETKKLVPKKLLGANESWLVYQSTCNNLVFLTSLSYECDKPKLLETFRQSFGREIVAYSFCNDTSLLWIVAKLGQGFCLYKINPKERTKDEFKIEIPDETLPEPTVLAVSSRGDVALEDCGHFIIYQPEKDEGIPSTITIGYSFSNNSGGYGCFATYGGHEYFIFSGKKYAEICVAKKERRKWQHVYNTFLEDATGFKLNDGLNISHLGVNTNGRLVVKVADHKDQEQKDQGILISSRFQT